MNALSASIAGTRPVARVWVLIWIAIIGALAATALVRGDRSVPPMAPATAEPGEVSTIAPGVTARVVSLEANAAEIIVSIQVDGRDDLGSRIALRGPAFLTDSRGEQHIERGGTIDGRVLHVSFPGLASLAPGPGVVHIGGIGLTNIYDQGPAPDDFTHVGAATLAVTLPASADVVRTALGEAAALGPGSVRIDTIVRSSNHLILEGTLEGFDAAQIQSLSLRGSRLVLADGSELPLAWARHGFGPELRGLELRFDLPAGAAAATELVLALDVQVPEPLKSAPEDIARSLAELEQAAGSTAAVKLSPAAAQGE